MRTTQRGYSKTLCAHESAILKKAPSALTTIVNAVKKNPGTAVEVGIFAVQFVPVVDVAVDVAVGTSLIAGQITNKITGHFSVGGAIVDATFTFPALFPALAETDAAKEILTQFATAVGGTGIGVGVLAGQR
jgi:hypothetical protein